MSTKSANAQALDVLTRGLELAHRYGPEVVKAWETVWQALSEELPELHMGPADAVYKRVRAQRDVGITEQEEAFREKLRQLGDDDPTDSGT